MDTEWLSLAECARVLGCSRVWAWKIRLKLKAEQVGGPRGMWIVRPINLRLFIEAEGVKDAQRKKAL